MRQTYRHGEVTQQTDDAVLFFFDEDQLPHWVPRSVIVGGDLIDIGDDELLVADWWLDKEGLLR